MADEIRSELSDDKDSLASGRISRWETKEFDQQSQISDTTSGTAITNMSRNDSQYQSRNDSRTTQDWTDSNVTSRNESHNQNQNESQNQGRNESQNQSPNDSQSKTPNDSLNQSQHDSQSKHRSESNKQSLNDSQNRNELQYDSIPQSRNASRNQSRNDSQRQVRNESRNESQNGNEFMAQSRNDSLNQRQNDSQNETQSRNDSQNDTRTQSQLDSLNQSQNYSDNHDRNYSQDQSRNDSSNQSRNDSQNRSRNDLKNQSNSRYDSRQSLEQDRSENVRDGENVEIKTMAENTDQSTFETQQCDVSNIDGGNQRKEFERSDSEFKVPGNIMKGGVSSCDSVSLVSLKSPTKSTESNKHGSQNRKGDETDSRISRNTDQSSKENNVTDNATQNLKGDEGHLDSKQQFENRGVKKKSELYDTAKEYDYRRASMPEVKHLANGYRHKGEQEVEHDRGEYAYRIAAEIRRPLLRTRRRKRIYGSDMYTSDGDMRRENGIARNKSDMTQNRLLQRTNSQRKLSDVVSSEVFRVRRRMSMPVQYIASSPEGQYNTEMKKETLPHKSGVCDEHIGSNNSNRTDNRKQENRSIHSHIDASAVGQEKVNSQNSDNANRIGEENDGNTQNTEKHQSVYDIYLELRKMRQVAAECVGTEVRQTIEQKLDKLQTETTEKEEENNWRRIQQKIIKVRKKLKEQEQKEKDRGMLEYLGYYL